MYKSRLGNLIPNTIVEIDNKLYVVLGDEKNPHICLQVNDIKFVYDDDIVDVVPYEEVEKRGMV